MTYIGTQNAYGGGYPATMWQRFMVKATQGLKSCPYNRPSNAVGSITDEGTGVSSPSSSLASGSTTTTIGHLPSSTTTTAPVTPTTVAPPTTVTPTTVTPTTAAPPTRCRRDLLALWSASLPAGAFGIRVSRCELRGGTLGPGPGSSC